MRWMFRLLAFALLGASLSSPARAMARLGPESVDVMVSNNGSNDVDVYAYRNGQRVRIGSVSAHSSTVVRVPAGMYNPGRVQLMLHPVTGGLPDFVSEEVAISGADHAELQVTPVLDESVLTVAPGRLRP